MVFLLFIPQVNMSEELQPSVLGTKTYWDDAYHKELENFRGYVDVGEVWFGEDSVQRVMKWLEKCNIVTKQSAILDLGCGNGISLIELHKDGYEDLSGVDYSENAIALATAIAENEQATNIKYRVCDITRDQCAVAAENTSGELMCRNYDVLLDKGTYDAISLCPDNATEQRKRYIDSTLRLLKPSGLLLLTSCNWTEEELKEQFLPDFAFYAKIPVPTFQFGGVTGNRETALVFQRKADS